MAKAPHILTKAHHIMTKAYISRDEKKGHQIKTKAHHIIMAKAPHITIF